MTTSTTHTTASPRIDTDAQTREQAQVAWGQLVLRLALGLPLIYHGAGILFGAFDGPGLAAFERFTHFPPLIASLVGIGELFGGLGVLTGVLARLAACGTGLVMAGAVLLVHLPNGYDIGHKPVPGMEYALTLFLLSLAVIIAGAGPYSLASLVKPRHA